MPCWRTKPIGHFFFVKKGTHYGCYSTCHAVLGAEVKLAKDVAKLPEWPNRRRTMWSMIGAFTAGEIEVRLEYETTKKSVLISDRRESCYMSGWPVHLPRAASSFTPVVNTAPSSVRATECMPPAAIWTTCTIQSQVSPQVTISSSIGTEDLPNGVHLFGTIHRQSQKPASSLDSSALEWQWLRQGCDKLQL